MSEDDLDDKDKALRGVLRRWTAPGRREALHRRVLASYRQEFGRPSLWRAFFTGYVRVPLPVAAVVLLLAIASAALAVRGLDTRRTTPAQGPAEGTGTPAAVADLRGFQVPGEIQVTIVKGER
jgi:hypothetical protein